MTLRARALGLLARREHSRAELARKLAAHGEEAEILLLLDGLEREGLLSERRFAESLAHARQGKHGSLRVRADLQNKGVTGAEMEAVLAVVRENDLVAARTVWQKKFSTLPHDAAERLKQARFLLGRGFPPEVVRRVLGGEFEDSSGI